MKKILAIGFYLIFIWLTNILAPWPVRADCPGKCNSFPPFCPSPCLPVLDAQNPNLCLWCSFSGSAMAAAIPTPTVLPRLIKLENLCQKVACPDQDYHFEITKNLCCTGGIAGIGEKCDKTVTQEGKTCLGCLSGGGVWTAIGCLPTDFASFLRDYVFRFGLGLSGGICFLLLLYGGVLIMTSSGVPEKLNEGKEVIVSALMGLILIIFSVLILKIVGVEILHLPGFG